MTSAKRTGPSYRGLGHGGQVIDLRLGDSLTGLADLAAGAVDVTITDPPFDARTHRAACEAGDWCRGRRCIAFALPFPHWTLKGLVVTLRAKVGRTGKKASATTVATTFVQLRAMVRWSMRRGLFAGPDVTDLEKPPRPGPGRDVILTVDEARIPCRAHRAVARDGIGGAVRWSAVGRGQRTTLEDIYLSRGVALRVQANSSRRWRSPRSRESP